MIYNSVIIRVNKVEENIGKIVAISGGDLESIDSINRFAIQLTEKNF